MKRCYPNLKAGWVSNRFSVGLSGFTVLEQPPSFFACKIASKSKI